MNEVNNKKHLTLTLVAVVTLLVLIGGATYAYFSVGATNNFNTITANAQAGSIGSVTLNGTNANLTMALTASEPFTYNSANRSWTSTSHTIYGNNPITLGIKNAGDYILKYESVGDCFGAKVYKNDTLIESIDPTSPGYIKSRIHSFKWVNNIGFNKSKLLSRNMPL